MHKTFRQLGFKEGDVVVCTNTLRENYYKKGDKFTLKYVGYVLRTDDEFNYDGSLGDWELVEKDMTVFEDQWHLNDGKVEIPDDADKLEKDGFVVAFRKRKAKPFEFGEKLRIKKSLWLINIEANPGLDYVDAVYLSKYFDSEDNEGIKVYVENGEKGWQTCLIDLSKVERLT